MHLLEPLAFVTKIQDAIVKEFSSALRMFLREFAKTPGKFVARFRHRAQPGSNFLEVVFLANTQGNRSINSKQLLL